MSFGTHDDTDEVMNEINMTPLVDVMLVLLIVFIITVPVMKHAVSIDLPRASSSAQDPRPQTVRLAVDARGAYHWNDAPLGERSLESLLRSEAGREPQPQLHIRADRSVPYEKVALAMAAAQRAGLRRIGFITEPGTPEGAKQ